MIQKVYSVFDSKTGVYSHPILRVTRGAAIRDFTDEVSNEKSPYAKHPEDFTFYELGEYDDNNGIVINHEPKVSLGSALELQSRTDLSKVDWSKVKDNADLTYASKPCITQI